MAGKFILCFLLLTLIMSCKAKRLNPIKKQIQPGRKPVHTRFFAKIPDYEGRGSRIVSLTSRWGYLYVCTSTSGGLIYRVSKSGKVKLWFDVANAMLKSKGRKMSMRNKAHGGLRSVAFHPNFGKNGLFYTAVMEEKPKNPENFKYFSKPKKTSAADSVVIEWKVNIKTKKPISKSYREVIRIGMPVYDHPIRALLFSGENLFITHGDGSVQSAIAGGGQMNDGLGKILRINPLKEGNKRYTIPGSNPFVKNKKWKNELYAVGFRNPITICKSKKKKVGLIVVDVGRDNVDEVNLVKPGGNYGWSKREGTFFHKEQGGLITGIGPLPKNDAKNNFIYPVVQVGHYNTQAGVRFIGQALTGSCPIENGSPLNNLMLYANFPGTGELYYSDINEMASARTKGPPSKLTQAVTYRPELYFDHDRKKSTPPKKVNNLRAIVRMDEGRGGEGRADIRFGMGSKGEIYWTSKTNGKIYLITSSVKGAKE